MLSIHKYQQIVAELYDQKQMSDITSAINQCIMARQQLDIPFGHDDPTLQALMDHLDSQLCDILITAKNKVAGISTKEGTRHRTFRKGPYSTPQKKIDSEIRDIDALLGRAKINKGAATIKGVTFKKVYACGLYYNETF